MSTTTEPTGPADGAGHLGLLLAPLWPHIAPDGDEPAHLLVVPTDDLFAVPFPIAVPESGVPLGARVPMSLSVSLSAFLLRGRSALRRQRVAPTDDLAAMVLSANFHRSDSPSIDMIHCADSSS